MSAAPRDASARSTDGQCPACDSELGPIVHQGVRDFEHGLDVRADFRRCDRCGLLLQVPIPTTEALRGYYPADYRPHATSSGGQLQGGILSRLKDLQAALLLGRLRPYLPDQHGRILELGCGSGHLLRQLRRGGYTRLVGVDRNPCLAETFDGTGIAFHACDLETEQLPVDGLFDAIVMSYVLEHFHDPEALLERCLGRLAPGGSVLVLTPSAASLCHRVFGSYWSGLHAPRHTQIFTPSSLRALARKLHFREVTLTDLTDPAGWALSFQNLVESRRAGAAPRAGTAWYSLASLPLWYPAALAERAFGQGQAMVASFQR